MPFSQTDHIMQLFDVSSPKGASQFPCTFTGCLGSSRTWKGLHNCFNLHQWGGSLRVLEEHPIQFTKCERCGSQLPLWLLRSLNYESDKCWIGEELRFRRTALQQCFGSIRVAISVNIEPLDMVAEFQYLGRTFACNNSS